MRSPKDWFGRRSEDGGLLTGRHGMTRSSRNVPFTGLDRLRAWWPARMVDDGAGPAVTKTERAVVAKPRPDRHVRKGHWVLVSHRAHPGRVTKLADEVAAGHEFLAAELSIPFPGSFALQLRDGSVLSRTDGEESAKRLLRLHQPLLESLRGHFLGPTDGRQWASLASALPLQDMVGLRDAVGLMLRRAYRAQDAGTLDIERTRLFMLRRAQQIERSWAAESDRLESISQYRSDSWDTRWIAEQWAQQRRGLAALDAAAAVVDETSSGARTPDPDMASLPAVWGATLTGVEHEY